MASQGLTNAHRREGLNIIRRIISTHPNISHSSQTATGLTTSELYKLALKEKPSEGFNGWREWVGNIRGPRTNTGSTPSKTGAAPRRNGKNPSTAGLPLKTDIPPHPEHPIRSMSYLKQEILPVLESSKEIKITRRGARSCS
ncbi:hypothetical protein BDN72DRAFT_398823 [Pluteus cervinus]|uniref:Uncharacterized protein n=1 Tax=Pluteus cervinus TaxID=181527 RepID=A0ACD3A979_9AGAR|nr:hypothetical protein BDN72DRAFT_398823 [Pluteus cervinus]